MHLQRLLDSFGLRSSAKLTCSTSFARSANWRSCGNKLTITRTKSRQFGELKNIEDHPLHLERVARETYYMVRPNEDLFRIVPAAGPTAQVSTE